MTVYQGPVRGNKGILLQLGYETDVNTLRDTILENYIKEYINDLLDTYRSY